ncbi:TetR/AcrR family transcriptional regulator [Henriciella sp.]|uniref:TetR/AcrR family transcriptional regulator n=1 Tax=Henriciella sp. TaxID=1968823 RepID=UPI0026156C5D|nr:TetR/AcrR family transcriptional regulator [Henriciella sp.]
MPARERILRAAIGLIAQHGADRVTHRLLASDMQMSPGTLTYHFKTRDELIREAFLLYMEDYGRGLKAALSVRPLTSFDEIARFLTTMTSLGPDQAELAAFEYEMIAKAQRDSDLKQAVTNWSAQLPRAIGAALEALGQPDASRTANLLTAICRGAEVDVLTRGVRIDAVAFRERIMGVLRAGL